MEEKGCSSRAFLIAAGIMGFLLIVFGVVLLGLGITGYDYAIIGTVVSGLLLLITVGAYHLLHRKSILCVILALVTLFLVIAGIVALPSIIGYVLIGLGVASLVLTALCFANC